MRCIVVNLVIHLSLGLLYVSVAVSPGFDFVFSVIVKRLVERASPK